MITYTLVASSAIYFTDIKLPLWFTTISTIIVTSIFNTPLIQYILLRISYAHPMQNKFYLSQLNIHYQNQLPYIHFLTYLLFFLP